MAHLGINFVLSVGASVLEGQTLARHATADMAMNVYGRTVDARLRQLVEDVGRTVLGVGQERNTTGAQKKAVDSASRSAIESPEVEAAGIESADAFF